MGQVWVNQKFLDTSHPKASKWNPDPKPEKKLWANCPDCDHAIYELQSCWTMQDKTVCVDNGCWEKYYEQGIGFHNGAGLDFVLALEG